MNVSPIRHPLPGEHLAATWPVMRPETDAGWQLRLNFWAGRALTADALELDQDNRASHLAWQGRAATDGIVTGLDVALEPPATLPDTLLRAGHFLHLLPGHGLCLSGEDATAPRPVRIPLEQIPVRYIRFRADAQTPPAEPPPAGATRSTPLQFGGLRLEIDDFGPDHVPWAAVLVLRPAELRAFGNLDPEDPCELDPSRDAFADERRLDASWLWLCQLPAAWETDPLLADRDDPRWRNRLAHVIFRAESEAARRQQLRYRASQPSASRWSVALQESIPHPWSLLGLPLGLLSHELLPGTTRRAFFLDRNSVARPGGRSRPRSRPIARLSTETDAASLNPPGAGTPPIWRARTDQFAEHLGTLDPAQPGAEQAKRFQFMPAAALLPPTALDLLTTADAQLLGAADRAAVSRFLPAGFAVEAVPIATEDLEAALAASAPLAPFDFASPLSETARILVPLPGRLFDPDLLVLEREDPIFADELGRLVAERQDWRQRRDAMRERRETLQALVTGPRIAAPGSALEPDQTEPEPTETLENLGFTGARLSPVDTAGPWELRSDLPEPRTLGPADTLFVRVRIDADALPAPIEVRWQSGAREVSFRWDEPPLPPHENVNPDGASLATPLWFRFTVTAAQLGLGDSDLTGFAFRLQSGRAALSHVGRMVPDAGAGQPGEEVWWRADDPEVEIQFTGGDWAPITGPALLAPFEGTYEPSFPDNLTLDQRLEDLDAKLHLAAGRRVREIGLDRLIAELERGLSQADDTIDLGFLKSQANVHRVRQVMLGEEVANQLLTSPALNSVIKTESARLAQDQLVTALKALPDAVKPAGSAAAPQGAIAPRPAPMAAAGFINTGLSFTGGSGSGNLFLETAGTGGGTVNLGGVRTTEVGINPSLVAALREDSFAGGAFAAPGSAAPAVKDVIGSEPAAGQGFELRTLSIAKRFDEGATRVAFNYADAELRTTLGHVARLDLGFDDDDVIPDATDAQGQPVSFARLAREGGALLEKLRFPAIATTDDSSAILGLGVRRSDAAVLILRRFEFYTARRREQLGRAREVRAAVQGQSAAAQNRLLTLDGRLGEARHDVTVARALRLEEQQRVDSVNRRRDNLIRDEVRFLACVRPRAVDPIRRTSSAWRLDPAGAGAALPACLQLHDEPPEALRAYVQLFRHAPAQWFTAVGPRLSEVNTREKVFSLLTAARQSALQFAAQPALNLFGAQVADAPRNLLQSAYSLVENRRRATAGLQIASLNLASWNQQQRDATRHASLGDILDGRHGQANLAKTAATELDQIETVATCLHAEFAAVAPGLRLAWVERYSQFDRPAPLDNLTALPRYGSLPRDTRRRFQAFVEWLFTRITRDEREAFNLINDLVRICLLLASHAPVRRIISGHIPRPVPVRPGVLIPIRPFTPGEVRVGMQFQVWRASSLVARGRVEDLNDQEVSARVEHVDAAQTTLDSTLRVQFVAAAFGLK